MILETFKNWAGKSSDISYYLNSHHIDFHSWALQGLALPMRVVASCAKGISKKVIDVDAEDTITLLVDWKNLESGNIGTASYTASWAASISDVHSQQRFFYLGHQGEITVDQAHRGYYVGSDSEGFRSVNPLYMRYVPDSKGNFVGQNGYGYKSFEAFVEAASRINSGEASPADFDESLATIESGIIVTAVLEAGRRSLDSKKPISIVYNDQLQPIRLEILS
jgi:D-galacturonate reductase